MSATQVDETEVRLVKSANHPTDDVSPAGGAKTTTAITNAAVGEWLPRLKGQAAGVIDVEIEVQYQKAFFENNNQFGLDLLNCIFYMRNMLIGLATITSATLKIVSTSAADGVTKKLRIWYERTSDNTLQVEDVILQGTTEVLSTVSADQFFRIVVLRVSDDSLTTLEGELSIVAEDGINPDEPLGIIPVGESWATHEVEFGLENTTDDSSTTANRKTAPGGIVFTRPNTLATGIRIRNNPAANTLAGGSSVPGEAQGIWVKQTIQPGMPPVPELEIIMVLEGDST